MTGKTAVPEEVIETLRARAQVTGLFSPASREVKCTIDHTLKAGGTIGVPQGGPVSPLAANIYLNEVDWYFDAVRRKTAEEPYEAVNYHRYGDDMVITVSGRHTKKG